ncbi:hypothetical protein HNQ51_001761 [Inhella inkyongensis]|uniref:Uncharacterized protein n=1 Tax=Inhella inkyongensis TaxID=392593 RepID=A0A840S058_9BURK|nr:hypothetical protein [Inhella inkyongensis]MBB5204447.1 hypothetical protein [Inhella inkyongensis]
MALTFLPGSLVIESDSSILDLPAFHAALRDWEDSAEAAVYPVTHTYKEIPLGGGAIFPAVDLVNGWQLRFPAPGNYTIRGNLGGTILPVAGVYVERQTSAAYVTTAIGGSGPSAISIAEAVRSELTAELVRLRELALLHGLEPGAPLVVDDANGTRSAGAVVQSVVTSQTTTTVSRQ